MQQDIPGTTIFDGVEARKGPRAQPHVLPFNSADNRAAFLKDEDGYCRQVLGLNAEQSPRSTAATS